MSENNKIITPKNGVWQKILDLLASKVGNIVSNEEIIKATNQHNYARRIRELRAEGWQIQYSNKPSGYKLLSFEKIDKKPGDYVNLRLRQEVLERDMFTCQQCGHSSKDKYGDGEQVKLEVDHILPLAEGGQTIVGNLQTLCSRCNAGKKAKIAYSDNQSENISMVIQIPQDVAEKLGKKATDENKKIKELIEEIITGSL